MSFDVNDPADLATLKNEEATDPAGVGYAGTGGVTQNLLDLFNLPANNPGAETSTARMTADALLRVLFTIAVGSPDQFIIQLMFEGAGDLNSDLSNYRLQTRALGAPIAGAIDTITRSLNRVEILFADMDANGVMEYVSISRSDWKAARES